MEYSVNMVWHIQVFEPFGAVELVQLPTDPETGHCKGFGFVQVSVMLAFYNLMEWPNKVFILFFKWKSC